MSYVPHTDSDRKEMLRAIGVDNLSDLFSPIPEEMRLNRDLALPSSLDEYNLLRELQQLSAKNKNLDNNLCFLGAGIYDHFVPAVVDALTSRGEFSTAYTPYQPEVSQGMLQAIYEYQTMICRLTAMDLANASMYDAATAIAEGALMASEITGRNTILVSRAVHPNYRQILRTYANAAGYCVEEIQYADGLTDLTALINRIDDGVACVVIQNPNFFGAIEDLQEFHRILNHVGALSVVSVDPISLGLLKPPGEYGADIVVGEGQSLGNAMGFGGPLLGFFACKMDYQRKFPGRIVGATTDKEGRRGYTMTLRTREQDIRRERATSNICTNETLMALAATVYLCEMGPEGLRKVADLCLQKAHYAQAALTGLSHMASTFGAPFFKEFAVQFNLGVKPAEINQRLSKEGIVGGYDLGKSYPELANSMLLCVTETRTRADIDTLVTETRKAIESGV